METSEPLMTADGFYEKNVGAISFFMRGTSRGEIFDVIEFCSSSNRGVQIACYIVRGSIA